MPDKGECKASILFVDDDEHLLQSMIRNLSKKFDVTIAASGSEALEIMEEKTFAVVVSDYQMPKMSGVEFFMQVKDYSPATTRIMLSGKSDMAVALEALNKGNVFRFLEKPTSAIELELVIIQAVEENSNYVETQKRMLYDTLTDSYNRKTILEYLSLEIERSRRYERPLSVAMMDIDHFKLINDSYGHLVGDMVLQEVVKCIRANLRIVDLIGRYGGEEFFIVFPETSVQQAAVACEKLRLCLHDLHFKEFQDLMVSASFGVGEYSSNDTEEMLIEQVDILLYEGKRSGRDIVVVQEQKLDSID